MEQLLTQRGFDVSHFNKLNSKHLTYLKQVLALSETHMRADQPTVLEPIEGYKTWSTERQGNDKGGGGLTIIYKESLTAHQWTPMVPDNLAYVSKERQWLLLDTQGSKKCAFLSIYMACQSSNSDHFIQWNEDLLTIVTQEAINLKRQGFMVLSMGDYNTRIGRVPGLEGNTPDVNRNFPMFMGFITEVNLFILNTLPLSKGLFTRFMTGKDHSSESLLDYGLADGDNVHRVTSFIIDENARYECGSDHALLECDIILGPNPHLTWNVQEVVQYDINDNTDFTNYRSNLELGLKTIPLAKFEALEATEMLPHISENLNKSAKETFGLKVKKQKRGTRLPKPIIKMIHAKNHLARTLRQADHDHDEAAKLLDELVQLKLRIKESITDLKVQKRNRLRTKILRADPTRRRFWRFIKSQTKAAGTISAINKVSFMNLIISSFCSSIIHL